MMSGKDSVKTSRFAFLALGCLVLLIPCVSFAATDRTWTGGGDGITWGDPANWEGGNVPATTSDTAVIASGASELVISNDVARNISAINISGESLVRIVGEQLTFSARNPAFKSTVQITVDAPIAFNYTAANSDAIIVSLVDSVFNGEISLLSPNRIVRFSGTGTARFYGSVGGESASIGVMMSNGIYFYAPINIKTIETSSTEYRKLYLASSGNKVSDGFNLHFTEVRFTVENALDESTPINFMQNTYKDNAATTVYYFQNGCDQVANYIQSDKPWYNGWKDNDFLNGASAMTLTLKATQSAYTYSCLRGALSLVYDPKGDFVQTFLDRKHLTTGSLMVKGGTLRMDGTNTFASVPSVTVGAGANFEVATTNSAALASVTALTLGDASRFSVVPTATSLFGSSATLVRACDSSRLVLSAGTVLRVGSLVVDGVPISPGDYTETGDGTRQTLAQVEGEGTLTVESLPSGTWWTGAIDDDYGNADNWSAGVPSGSLVAYIEKLGSAATVQSSDEIVHDLSSFPSDDTTLAYEISHGGTLHVAGGSLSITNIRGKVVVGGDASSVTSKIEVASGFLGLYASKDSSFSVADGGVLSMTGGAAEYRYMTSKGWRFRMTGGMLDLSGDSEFKIWMHSFPCSVFGTGVVDVRGTAKLLFPVAVSDSRSVWTPSAANETLTVNFSGDSVFTASDVMNLAGGCHEGAKTVINASDNARMCFAKHVVIGFGGNGYGGGAGSVGELNISGNAVVSNTTGRAFYVGKFGTASVASEGIIRITGGCLAPKVDATGQGDYGGIVLGYDTSAEFSGIYNHGTLEISSGTLKNNTNGRSWLVVGMGNSEGKLLQSGGTVSQGAHEAYVGYRGGIGLYRFTGGTANFGSCDFHVGADGGKGTLEIGAGSGTFTSKNLNLTNSTSTLKFKLGADGSLATLNVTTMFKVANGAKLVVDATHSAGVKTVTLMTFGSRSGEFAAENIEIIAARPDRYRVEQMAGSIRFVQDLGLIMIVK